MDKMEMLEKYLDGQLTAEEMRIFEAGMARDEMLSKEYQIHQDMSRALLNDKAGEFRSMLDTAHQRYQKRDRRPLFYKMAAAIAIFLTVGGLLLLLTNHSSSSRDIADKYYKAYQPLNTVRSDDPNQGKLVSYAFNSYEKGDYLTAARHFETLLKLNPENNQVRFYLAVSYMENKQQSSAIRLFQEIIDNRDVYYRYQSEWYLGICYLWLGRKDEAILPFERLAKKKGYYQEQARKMITEINKQR